MGKWTFPKCKIFPIRRQKEQKKSGIMCMPIYCQNLDKWRPERKLDNEKTLVEGANEKRQTSFRERTKKASPWPGLTMEIQAFPPLMRGSTPDGGPLLLESGFKRMAPQNMFSVITPFLISTQRPRSPEQCRK